ncbi:molybdenum cofactor guanylyltransferase [Pseudovibrio sp. Tun.PSC04-5.I4]|nr:molybdenum cofactor guanylyltransferase [Pseudovibrio sp. Tun.PSC04-5.I4]
MMSADTSDIIGCILCGGKSRRMGGADKALIELEGSALLERVVTRLQSQLHQIVVSVNEPGDLHEGLQLPLLADKLSGHLGPLAGVHSALCWAQENEKDAHWVMTAAVDTPFFPEDLAGTLKAHAEDALPNPVICSSAGRDHYTFGLWPVALADPLKTYLLDGGRSLRGFFESYPPKIIEFEVQGGLDPFFNINSPEDIPVALAHIS